MRQSAHGGAFVARTEQGVIFVRHGIVGEQAEVRITAIGPKRRFYFADVISVPVPSLARRPPLIQADAPATDEERAARTGVPELLGGMEYGHISLAGAGPTLQDRYRPHPNQPTGRSASSQVRSSPRC